MHRKMWDGKLSIFLCAVFLTQFAHIRTDLNLQENHVDEETENFLNEGSSDDLTENFLKDPPLRADCKCTNGKCVKKDGKEVCECPPEFGNYTSTYCKACKCGPGANCTIESGLFTKITCICPKGYRVDGEKCVGPCQPNPCKNKATCKDVKNGFECICPSTHTGKTCEIKVDACTSKPCQNGGTCKVKGKTFKCSCQKPYSGDKCEIGPCNPSPCLNGGNCTVKGSDFKCTCKTPYTGLQCEKLDPCASKPCLNGGTCTASGKDFKCSCKPPYAGDKCERLDPCASKPCLNGGTCTNVGKNFNCSCKPPYAGEKCEKLDPCASKPCLNGGACTIKGNGFNCTCKLPFFGEKCEKDPCHPNQCKNGGICSIKDNNFSCLCKGIYFGNKCERECKCQNGKCRLTAAGKEVCDCLPEFGKYNDDLCKACDCGTGANCTFDKGFFSDDKYCICPDGSTLKNTHCEDPCKINPCKNNGICKPEGKSKTKCECKLPYTGPTCEQDLCSNNPCQNGGTCKIKDTAFTCNCKVPHFGPKCEKDPCTDQPCLNGGICNLHNDSFVCNCSEPFSGKKCEKDPCSDRPCWNGGTCVLVGNTFKCVCPTNYSGRICENDPCWSEPCLNGGFCIVEKSSFKCQCKDPYEGDKCEIMKTSTTQTSAPTTTISPSTSTSRKPTSVASSPPTSYTSPDFNKTTFTSSSFTEEINTTTYEPSKYTYDNNTSTVTQPQTTNSGSSSSTPIQTTKSGSSSSTPIQTTKSGSSSSTPIQTTKSGSSTSTFIQTTTTVVFRSTSTKIPGNVCSKNPCQNGGTCVPNDKEAKCICAYSFAGKFCNESHWCVEGAGKTLCPEGKCVFNLKTKVSRCECPKDQFFNYEKKQCETIDRCPFMPGKCTGQYEICKNGECQCMDNFTRNSEKKCVPNFCASNPCGENEVCEEIAKDPGNVKCTCKKNFFFDGNSCQEGNICSVPSVLGCQQICNSTSQSCECVPGFSLQADKKSCKIDNSTDQCSQECGVGVCVQLNNEDTCVCPPTHLSNGSYCIDLCSAAQVPKGLCPSDDCIPDEKLGFKCKCEGKLTYDETGVTCRKKLKCSEGNGTKTCAKYNARCVEDSDHIEGFRCVCDVGKGKDTDGVCKNKCELSKQKEECQARKATCELDGLEAICRCPPMLTFDPTGQCTQLVKVSYSGELPLAMNRYALKKQSSPSTKAEENSINYDAIKKDLRASMHLLFGENYKFADILNCRILDQDVKCLFEVQFHSDPKDQVNLITDDNTCVSADANTCFFPPSLLIDKKNLKSGSFAETDPCLKDIKEQNCGSEMDCKKIEGKGLNFECTCADGLESYGILQPLYDINTIIHKCQDVDECMKPRACPNRTRCLNTYRSYECQCQKGFRPITATSNPKISGCVDVCDATLCKNGKCQVIGDVYGCLCNKGYTGLSCDQEEDKTAGSSGMRTALIVLSTFVVPLILFSLFILYKYRLLLSKDQQTNYLDDQTSSTINLQPMRNSGILQFNRSEE